MGQKNPRSERFNFKSLVRAEGESAEFGVDTCAVIQHETQWGCRSSEDRCSLGQIKQTITTSGCAWKRSLFGSKWPRENLLNWREIRLK